MGKVEKLYEKVREDISKDIKIKEIIVGKKMLKLLKEMPNIIIANADSEIPIFVDSDFKPYQYEIVREKKNAKKKDNN